MIDDPSFRLPVFYPIENKLCHYQKELNGWLFSQTRGGIEELVSALKVAAYWKERYEKIEKRYGEMKLKELLK